MGRRSRVKGATWERALANFLKGVCWEDAKRGIGQTRAAGEVCDVEGTPLWIEAKVGRRPNIKAALEQAEAATDGRPCVVVARFDGAPLGEAIVACRLKDVAKVWGDDS